MWKQRRKEIKSRDANHASEEARLKLHSRSDRKREYVIFSELRRALCIPCLLRQRAENLEQYGNLEQETKSSANSKWQALFFISVVYMN